MHCQELATHEQRKRVRDEDQQASQGSDGSNSREDSQSEELSALDEDEDDQESISDISVRDEEDAVPSRFSFKPHQSTVSKNTASSDVPAPLQTFRELGVSSSLVTAMNKMSIHAPTEVQVACIPPLLDGMCFLIRSFPLMLNILAR